MCLTFHDALLNLAFIQTLKYFNTFKTPALKCQYPSYSGHSMPSETLTALRRNLGVESIKTETVFARSGVWHLTVTAADTAVKSFQIQTTQSLHLSTKLMHELVNIIYFAVTRSPERFGKCISLNHIKWLTFDLQNIATSRDSS